jgi:hypothetical protein
VTPEMIQALMLVGSAVVGYFLRHYMGGSTPVNPTVPVVPAPSTGHPLLDLLAQILKSLPPGAAQQQAIQTVVSQLAGPK